MGTVTLQELALLVELNKHTVTREEYEVLGNLTRHYIILPTSNKC